MNGQMWTPNEFEEALRAAGRDRYHAIHPFHVRMNAGQLDPRALRVWAYNRFYYQRNLPRKDAAILANCPERDVRREWVHRIPDHDGDGARPGGIEAWLRLAEGCGLDRESVLCGDDVLPGVRFAVDSYVRLAREKPWPVAVASSLTEWFAPDLMARRLEAFRSHYKWVPETAFTYFVERVTRARSDAEEALAVTLRWCDTPELQREAVAALVFKCDVLWHMLDATDAACA